MTKHKEDTHKHGMFIGLMLIQTVIMLVIVFQVGAMNGKLDVAGMAVKTAEGNTAQAAGANQPSQPSQPTAPAPSPTLDMIELMGDDPVKGDPDAPVTIIEWSDFQCPFCARFYTQTMGQIDENYIKTGKVKLVFRDFPLGFHENAQKAAEASECADDQGKFWEYHDTLFENPSKLGLADLKQHASDLGLNTDDFNSCLDSGKYADEVKEDMAAGAAAGIRGTPGFIINGVAISGAQPYANFEAAIEAALNS